MAKWINSCRFVAIVVFVTIWFTSISISQRSLSAQQQARPNKENVAQVFVLAGQSNMEGQGVVDLDHPEHYNGGAGTLVQLMGDDEFKKRFAHLQTPNGKWAGRDDVFVHFKTRDATKFGPLSIGFTGYEGRHHIGPELQFGHVVGDAIDRTDLVNQDGMGRQEPVQRLPPTQRWRPSGFLLHANVGRSGRSPPRRAGHIRLSTWN